MQISGANLLIAAQQQQPQAAARSAQQPNFAAAMAKSGEAPDAAFAPLDFKAAEPPKPLQAAVISPVQAEPKPGLKLGSMLDIRV